MPLLSVRQAATRLGIGYSTLKKWIRDGYARTTTTAGGHHRLSDAEIDRLLHVTASPAAPSPLPPVSEALYELSARNRLHGVVEEVRTDGLLAQVRLRIGSERLTAVITRDAVDHLKLKRGDDAMAVIKSTEVMIARPQAPPPVSTRMPRVRGSRRGGK